MKMKVNRKQLEQYIALCSACANTVKGTALENEFKKIAGLIADIRMFADVGETVKFENYDE